MLDFHLRCLREWQIRVSESYLFTFQLVVADSAESCGKLSTANFKTFKTWASLVATDTLAASASIITSYGAVTSSMSSSTDVTISSSGLHLKSTVVAAAQPSPPKLYSLTSPPATPESPPGPPRLDYGGVPVENFVEDVSVKVPSVLHPNFETSSTPPPPTTRFNASSRGYLSEVKNSFGPRQSTIIDKKSRGALPQPPSGPPSWRDL